MNKRILIMILIVFAFSNINVLCLITDTNSNATQFKMAASEYYDKKIKDLDDKIKDLDDKIKITKNDINERIGLYVWALSIVLIITGFFISLLGYSFFKQLTKSHVRSIIKKEFKYLHDKEQIKNGLIEEFNEIIINQKDRFEKNQLTENNYWRCFWYFQQKQFLIWKEGNLEDEVYKTWLEYRKQEWNQNLTIRGLEESIMYYSYQDNYKNVEEFLLPEFRYFWKLVIIDDNRNVKSSIMNRFKNMRMNVDISVREYVSLILLKKLKDILTKNLIKN